MISDKDLPELENYRRLEQNLPIRVAPDFGPLVVSGENDNAPVHRWFKYKEAYSGRLLQNILSYARAGTTRRGLVLLDPYCGVGTSLLSAQTSPNFFSFATGIERNPFVAFVARAKLGWPTVDTKELERMGIAALAAVEMPCTLPELSSIRTGRCISRYIAGRLLSVRNAILEFPESTTRNALLLGLAAAIEPLSRVRKDGRALRLVDRSHQHVVTILMQKWIEIQLDVTRMQSLHKDQAKTKVQEGEIGRAHV